MSDDRTCLVGNIQSGANQRPKLDLHRKRQPNYLGHASGVLGCGRKVFTCRIEPHMFGYCGDVVFPSLAIAQIVSAIDNGVLFRAKASADDKHEAVYASLKKSFV